MTNEFRSLSTSSSNNTAVAVMGASGGIGQPLSLLLKLNPAGIAQNTKEKFHNSLSLCPGPMSTINYHPLPLMEDSIGTKKLKSSGNRFSISNSIFKKYLYFFWRGGGGRECMDIYGKEVTFQKT